MSIYAFEGIKVLLEEADELLAHGWELERRDTDWGLAYLYRPLKKPDKQGIGGSLHQEVPSYLPINPTRRHALSNPSEAGDQEERLLAAGEANRKLAMLTTEERQALLLHAKQYVTVEEIKVPVDEVSVYLEGGWFLVRQENGQATLSGEFVTGMTQEQIAELLGVSTSTVCRRLKSAFRKLGRFA